MKARKIIFTVLIVLIPVLPAIADQEHDGKGKFMAFFDTNNDGMVNMDEFNTAAAARFTKMDADGNGLVNHEEFMEYVMERREERRSQWFAKMDSNSDGQLSEKEYIDHKVKRAQMQFKNMDENNDGVVNAAEFENQVNNRPWGKHHGKGGMKGGKFFSRLDKNGDGNITREESLEAWTGWFKRMDKDNNQVVTTDEVAAFRKYMKNKDQ